MLTHTNRVIARARFTLHFRIFATFPCGGENQNEVLPSERGASGTVPYGKSGPGYCITFIQRLDEHLR